MVHELAPVAVVENPKRGAKKITKIGKWRAGLPGKQATQKDAPVVLAKCPRGHLEQGDKPCEPTSPRLHSVRQSAMLAAAVLAVVLFCGLQDQRGLLHHMESSIRQKWQEEMSKKI